MTTVDPYVVRIPDSIVNKDGSPSDQFIAWLNYDNRWKHDLWRLTTGGTGTDETVGAPEASANENQISQLLGLLSSALQRIEDLEANTAPQIDFTRAFNNVTKISAYTAVDHDFINAKSSTTITLPENPEENSVIIIRNGDGSTIEINPNGKNINGESLGYIRRKGTALVIHYFIDSDEWLVR